MADKSKNQSPPYATFASFLNFINKLRETQVPSRIDPSVFGNASGSLSYSIIAALKSLKLIGSDGVPSEDFIAFVKADDDNRKAMMRDILKTGYPTLWTGSISVNTTTAGQFDEHIRSEYDVKGSTVDKVAAFFIAAAKYCDMMISPHLAARKPTASSASSNKSKRQRKVNDSDSDGDSINVGAGGYVVPPNDPAITDKALEYKLVDLMREDGIDADERSAIWTLLQYLTAKAKKAAPDKTTASDL